MAMLALALDCQMLDQVQQRVIGTAATLLMNDPSLRGAMAQILSEEVVPASRHGKLAFFLNFDRVPVGFITWAHLSEETETRLLQTLDPWLHISEWNEGSSLWVRQFFLPRHLRREAVRLCKAELFTQHGAVRIMVTRKSKQMAVELDSITSLRWGILSSN